MKLDGIYRKVKIEVTKPQNKRRIAWGTFIGIIFGLIIVVILNLSSPPRATEASLKTLGITNNFSQKNQPSFVLNTTGIIETFTKRQASGELKWGDNKIKAEIFQKAAPKDFVPEITSSGKDEFEIKLNQSQFTAGKYDLKVTVANKDIEKTFDQEFTWGVLAINTNKTIYLPGDKAYLGMAVLKDDGHTICDGDLALEVTNPKGEIQKFAKEVVTVPLTVKSPLVAVTPAGKTSVPLPVNFKCQ